MYLALHFIFFLSFTHIKLQVLKALKNSYPYFSSPLCADHFISRNHMPPNVNIMCYDDIHYLPQVGVPTVFGYPSEILEY